MFENYKNTLRIRNIFLATASLAVAPIANAQDLSINYDNLSILEEPLATEIGDVTFVLSGVMDASHTHDFSSDDNTPNRDDADFLGAFELSAETQLSNRWTLGAVYLGQFETTDEESVREFQDLRGRKNRRGGSGGSRPGTSDVSTGYDVSSALETNGSGDYSDSFAAYVSGAWGTVMGGNVGGLVHEDTRRTRGVGNADLQFDDLSGDLAEWNGGYVGRFGPTRISTVIDEDGNFQIGGFFQRPIGNKDYRLSARYAQGDTESLDGLIPIETKGAELVGEFIYGSSIFNLSLGAEHLDTGMDSADRWYLSGGAERKIGVLSFSGEAHFGEVDGQSETAVALGAAYDIARGLSLNLGLNYQEANIVIGSTPFYDVKETKGVVSLRYSF